MRPYRLPRIFRLTESNLSEHYHHSVLISALRGLAALQVVAAHLRAQLFPGLKGLPDPSLWYQALAFFTGFAHQAVVIFFVLSGWLVGGSLLNKRAQPGIMFSYTLDRLTRLWIVLIPVFLLSLLFAALMGTIDPFRPDLAATNAYSLTAFVGNLFGLQDMAVPRFGGNFALWSLANETWYYVLFPLLVLVFFGKSVATRWSAGLVALLIAASLNVDLTLYFSLWLLGLAFSRIRIDASGAWLAVMVLVFVAVSVVFRLIGSNDILLIESFPQDLLFSLSFLLILASLQTPINPAHRPTALAKHYGNMLAAFSFTLYVIHVPLLVMMRHLIAPYLNGGKLSPQHPFDFAVYLVMLLAIMLLAWLFHLPFEAQTVRVRRKLKQWLSRPARVPVGAAATGVATPEP